MYPNSVLPVNLLDFGLSTFSKDHFQKLSFLVSILGLEKKHLLSVSLVIFSFFKNQICGSDYALQIQHDKLIYLYIHNPSI